LVAQCKGPIASRERSVSIPASTMENSKKAVARKFSRRALRGLAMVAMGGQIRRVNDRLFFVNSQAHEGEYEVKWSTGGWSCECEDFRVRGKPCKHIFAVDFVLKLPKMIQSNQDALRRSCPACGSNDVICKGRRYNKGGSVQVLWCKSCGRKFGDGVHKGNKMAGTPLAVLSVDLYYKGVSVRNISNHILQVYGIRKSPSTIHGWISAFRKMLNGFAESAEPSVGEKWSADEMVLKVKGRQMYLWNVLDCETRYLLASILTEKRGADEAFTALKAAVERAGKAPRQLVTDGLPSYSAALKRLGLVDTKHTGRAGIAKVDNNNRIERLHNTVRAITRARRGVKAGSDLIALSTYYNLIRPNLALQGRTPGQESKSQTLPFWRSLAVCNAGATRSTSMSS